MAKKVTLDLSVFKSSGVYTVEFDASENIIVNPQTVRLVVGFSNVGPFNTPVFLPDPQTAIRIFGDIDRTLEKKGSFFHRSLLTCLASGPVFGLNLLSLNNTVDENGDPDYANGADVARYRAFSLDTEEANGNNSTTDYSTLLTPQDKLVASYYNKQKFWFPDPDALLATSDTASGDKTKLLHMVNLSQRPVSIIVRKSLDARIPLRGFDITAKEYYGVNNIPNFVNEYDYISDYFIDVYVVSGNWTNYQALSNDPIYSTYFTPKGFVKAQIDNFLALPEINLVASATGCLIPDFVDQNGVNRYIKTQINNSVGQTGILCSVNEEALDDLSTSTSLVDLVGHHLIDELDPNLRDMTQPPSVNFLSYNAPLLADFVYEQNTTSLNDLSSPGFILDEVGTLFENVLVSFNEGVPTSFFAGYSPSLTDGGFPYLQTNIPNSNANKTAILNAISDFLAVTVSSPASKWILGKVLSGSPIQLPTNPFQGFFDGDLVKLKVEEVKTVTVLGEPQLRIKWSHPLYLSTSTYYVEPSFDTNLDPTSYQFGKADYFDYDDLITSPVPVYSGLDSYFGYEESPLYQDHLKGLINDGDTIRTDYLGTTVQYIKFEKSVDRDGFKTISLKTYSDSGLTTGVAAVGFNLSYTTSANGPSDTVDVTNGVTNGLAIVSLAGNLNSYVDIVSIIAPNQVEITEASATASGIAVGQLLVSEDLQLFTTDDTQPYQNRLTRIKEVKRVATTTPGLFTIYVKTDRPIKVYAGSPSRINKFKPIHEFVTSYHLTYLPGFQIKASHKPNGTDARLDEILDVLFETNIAKTLADRNVITFRYVVDTFDGQIKDGTKNQLSRLAKLRGKCLALLNAPSIKKFVDSVDPRFTDAPSNTEPAPLLNARYIAEGGNLSLNPSFTFNLPNEDLGSKFAGFFTPFLTIRENNKNLNIPPAAHVSNNFIRKFVVGEPYSIVAGDKRGVLSGNNLSGLEYEFDREDRDFIEPFGLNPIIRRRGVGLVIYGNQTAFQRVNSAFNNIHVRDLLITLEEAIEDILSNYVFDFNEDSVRLEIKTLVDNFLDGVRSVGGIYGYSTIMDSSNNTQAIINQNLGIIDIIVEPARGIHKFINRLTVVGTGGSTGTGFIQFS